VALLAFSPTVHILLDYRPALRDRTGVGEYAHELARALAATGGPGDRLTLFTSSWSDRPDRSLVQWPGTTLVDRRVPVRVLNWAWHRVGWPPVESLAGEIDIAQSLHPLMLPTSRARSVVTVHDLDFLQHPERTSGEIRRDYPDLVRRHAAKAALVVTNSQDTTNAVESVLGVPRDRIVVCRPGLPAWIRTPVDRVPPADGYVLFVGTLEPRKNLGALLDAWEDLIGRGVALPLLRIAGGTRPGSEDWVARMSRPPLRDFVDYVGYVRADARPALYEGAKLVVLPSHHEGFGLPVLEAMALGVPVVASTAGALPEVLGDAAILVGPNDRRALADAIQRVLTIPALSDDLRRRGLARARQFSWTDAAHTLREAYSRMLLTGPSNADRH
jgi:glycosyltransferase involved in cell wall biosynthesis